MSMSLDFLKEQRESLPIIPAAEDCEGRTFIITGANTGLGYECAKHYVRLGAKQVILGVRSLSRGEIAKTKIEMETGRDGIAEVWELDLSSFQSVKDFAKRVSGLERVDVFIENAGIALDKHTIAERLETTLTVNVVSTILLALLVLPKLQETAKTFDTEPHVVIIGSGAAFDAKGELEKISGDFFEGLTHAPIWNRYPTSKLLLLYATRQLAVLKPVSETGVVINYLNPGLCKTELSRHVGLPFRLIFSGLAFLLGRTAEEGSRTLLQAAMGGKESHGKYLSGCKIKEWLIPTWVTEEAGKDMQTRVWTSLSRRLNTIEPRCV